MRLSLFCRWLSLQTSAVSKTAHIGSQHQGSYCDPTLRGSTLALAYTRAAQSETLTTILTNSKQHGIFVRLLQRTRLIPVLSHMNGTVFAPTDQAWRDWEKKHKPDEGDQFYDHDGRYLGWLGSSGLDEYLAEPEALPMTSDPRVLDNQHFALRQHLLYHVLNYTITQEEWLGKAPKKKLLGLGDEPVRIPENITVEETLLFPQEKAPKSPVPGGPWVPGNGNGLLGHQGQRLRVARPGSQLGGERGLIGLNERGEEGVGVWDGSGWSTDPPDHHLNGGSDNSGQGEGEKEKDGDDKDKDGGKKKDPKEKYKSGGRWGRNGGVIGLIGVLEPPPSMSDAIKAHPKLQYLGRLLANVLPDPFPPFLDSAPHVTLFAASDDAFEDAFDELERKYLEGPFGTEGVTRAIGPTLMMTREVGWSTMFKSKPTNVTTATNTLEVVKDKEKGHLIVNGTTAEIVDIYTANGVIHIMPKLILPDGFQLLNSVEKVLLSRNATRFVSLMRTANLSEKYIGVGKDKEYTVLAPTDDAIDYLQWWNSHFAMSTEAEALFAPRRSTIEPAVVTIQSGGDEGVPDKPKKPDFPPDVSPLVALLQYHIIGGRYQPRDMEDGLLLDTELHTKELNGKAQRIPVAISERRSPKDNDDAEIRFGGAMAIGQPVKSGKSIIYFVSAIVTPPLDMLQTAVGDLQLSTYIAAVYAAGLEKTFNRNVATSFFIPSNKAFKALGLVTQYLLLPEAREEIRKLLRYHAVEKLIYAQDIEYGNTVFKTIEGGDFVLTKNENATRVISKKKGTELAIRSPTKWSGHDSGTSLPSNAELASSNVTRKDHLTETGVIHVLDGIVLPSDLSITIAQLIRGSKQRTMVELMIKAGFSWILEGRPPTKEEAIHAGLKGGKGKKGGDDHDDDDDVENIALPAYTVLVPTDRAFARLNLTYYLNDKEALAELVKLHVIPSSSTDFDSQFGTLLGSTTPRPGSPLALNDNILYPTMNKGDYGRLAFRSIASHSKSGDDDDSEPSEGYIVGVHNARGVNSKGAEIGLVGRATVRWRRNWDDDPEDPETPGAPQPLAFSRFWSQRLKNEENPLLRNGMTLGGGVLMIDQVLEPYHPSWFVRYQPLLLTLGIVLVVSLLLGAGLWWWKHGQGGKIALPADDEDEEEQEQRNRNWRDSLNHANGNGSGRDRSGSGNANGNGRSHPSEAT